VIVCRFLKHFRAGMHNSNLMAGQKVLLKHSRARLVKFFQFLYCLHQKSSQILVNLGFAGQIESFRGPHLARGPYVVHACYRA